MSVSFEIVSSQDNYQVQIEKGLLTKTLADIPDALMICDAALVQYLPKKPAVLIAVEATETAKDLSNLAPIIAQLKDAGAHRKSLIYAVGGGVIQDIACFVATIYMRGCAWRYFPTTLLGMADSCIGGKSSINVGGFKNLVGTFYPPEAVMIDPSLADTLPMDQKVAGLMEAIKICYAHTGSAFDEYLALDAQPTMNSDALASVMALTLRTKKWFIEIDEFDRKERQLLNFGHTFGHAMEGATNYAIPHGIAVGLGMLCALWVSAEKGYAEAGKKRVAALQNYVESLLSHVPQVRADIAKLDAALCVQKFKADKKHLADAYRMIAPNADGFLQLTDLPKTAETLAHMEQQFTRLKNEYGKI